MGVNSFCEVQQCGCQEDVYEKSMTMQRGNVSGRSKESKCKGNEDNDNVNVDINEDENYNYNINYYNNSNRNKAVYKGIKIVMHVIKVKMVLKWKMFFKEMKLLQYIHNLKRIQPIYHNVSTDETTLTSINNNNNNNNINTHLQLFAYHKQYPSVYLGTKTKNKGKDGFGIEKFNNNSYTIAQYIGAYSNNTAHGYGIFTTYNEHHTQLTSYSGEFVNAYANGFGIYINEIKSIKTYGIWYNDIQHSIAIEEWKDGSIYEGEFHNGNKNGIGVYKWNNGSTYSGTWKNNTINGYGIYINNNSFNYIGEWCNNKKEGFGLYSTCSYKHYGLYKNDKRNGFGIMLWNKHNKAYIGFWKEGNKDGVGKFITNERSVYGVWNDKDKKKIEQICDDMFYVLLDSLGLSGFKNMFKFTLEDVVQFMDEMLIC
jgi:hypothetical protein